jgi:hypothetical protein
MCSTRYLHKGYAELEKGLDEKLTPLKDAAHAVNTWHVFATYQEIKAHMPVTKVLNGDEGLRKDIFPEERFAHLPETYKYRGKSFVSSKYVSTPFSFIRLFIVIHRSLRFGSKLVLSQGNSSH